MDCYMKNYINNKYKKIRNNREGMTKYISDSELRKSFEKASKL